jgi:hypothetical protein
VKLCRLSTVSASVNADSRSPERREAASKSHVTIFSTHTLCCCFCSRLVSSAPSLRRFYLLGSCPSDIPGRTTRRVGMHSSRGRGTARAFDLCPSAERRQRRRRVAGPHARLPPRAPRRQQAQRPSRRHRTSSVCRATLHSKPGDTTTPTASTRGARPYAIRVVYSYDCSAVVVGMARLVGVTLTSQLHCSCGQT